MTGKVSNLRCMSQYQYVTESVSKTFRGMYPLAAQTLILLWLFSPGRHICPEPAEIACEHFCLHVLVEPLPLLFGGEPFDFEHKGFHQFKDVDEIAKEAFEIDCACRDIHDVPLVFDILEAGIAQQSLKHGRYADMPLIYRKATS